MNARRPGRQFESQAIDYLEGLMEGFVAYDGDWRMTYMNAAAEALLGRERADVLGKTWHEAFPHAVGNAVDLMYQRIMRSRRPEQLELYYEHYGRWMEVSASPLANGGIGVYFRDSTPRRLAEEALREEAGRLARSERELSDFFDNATVGLHWVGPDGTILRANQAELDMLGYRRDEYVGRNIAEFHAEEATIRDILQCLTSKETLHNRAARLRCKDGSIKDVLISSNVLWEEDRFIHTRCFTRDVTEFRRAEAALRGSERRLGFLVDLALATGPLEEPDDIMAVTARLLGEHLAADRCAYAEVAADGDEFVITGNYAPRAGSIVGRWRMSAFGREVHRLMLENRPYILHDADSDPRVSAQDLAAYRATEIRAVICVPLHKAGKFVAAMAVHQTSARRWTEEEAELVQMVVGRCWESLERARVARALRDADRRKDEFLAMLSHELRNPLAPIRNALEVLQIKGPPDPELKSARDMIARQVRHMVRLIDDLLDVSRITQGKLELRRQPIELGPVLDEALEATRPLRNGHDVVVALPAAAIRLDADPVRLTQVLTNLLSNAFKYTDEGGKVWVSAQCEDGHAQLSVRDTGIGIDAQHMPRLFEMFSQAPAARERARGGLGIGLSLARALVQMHGGELAVSSDGPGRGSEFVVRLPLRG